MKLLLFLAKGFETMEASVFVDVFGWAKISYGYDVEVVTCGVQETVTSAFGIPVKVDVLLSDVCSDEYDALAIPGGFEEYGFYDEAFSAEVGKLIKDFETCNKAIASVCVGSTCTCSQRNTERKREQQLITLMTE